MEAKIVRLQSLPLGGKVDKAKLWTNEGRILFSIRIFSIKWRNLFALPLAFPFGESGGEAADRGLFKISPYVAPFPCFPLRGEWREAPREVPLASFLKIAKAAARKFLPPL